MNYIKHFNKYIESIEDYRLLILNKYINSDEPPPPSLFAKPVKILFKCENRSIISYVMISIIVRIKIIRFPINDSIYFDYIIGKLSIIISSIVIHRTNMKVYIDYKIA
jgi:hypothetical protein